MPQLAVGDTAPDFTLPDAAGADVSLTTLRRGAEHGVVVYFYPRASTPGCTKEACDFRDSLAAWAAAGYAVVGISPDSPRALANFARKQSLPFPLLSDPEHRVMEEWGAWARRRTTGAPTRESSAPPLWWTPMALYGWLVTTSGPPAMSPVCARSSASTDSAHSRALTLRALRKHRRFQKR